MPEDSANRKARHEQFVTGLRGGTIGDIYAVIGICALGIITHRLVARAVRHNALALQLADYVFNWATLLLATTLYANRLPLLAAALVAVSLAAVSTSAGAGPLARPATRPENARPKDSRSDGGAEPQKPAYRQFLTIYRSAMMVLTATAILAVDFPAFPRRFAKTETWGTSLMDLGVGSFVFSMGIVSSRGAIRHPNISFRTEAISSLVQTAKVLALGCVRLATVKMLDYQEHESEYGVHWNFFFTLGLLPLAFVFLKRFPVPSTLGKAAMLAVGYELALKNTGLMEWALTAPRTSLVSQNKEGITSFAGYLAIFSFGYAYGLRLMSATASLKDIFISSVKWAVLGQATFSLLRVATEPSRRLANLPYISWVVAFNTGFIGIFVLAERLLGLVPSRSYEAINSYGELIFVLANVGTGIINLNTDTMALSPWATQGVLVTYQVSLMALALYLYGRKPSRS